MFWTGARGGIKSEANERATGHQSGPKCIAQGDANIPLLGSRQSLAESVSRDAAPHVRFPKIGSMGGPMNFFSAFSNSLLD